MKENHSITFLSALLFLLFIQQITFLIESIYMLNLLHTSMDLKALGVLFLLLPVLLIFFRSRSNSTYIVLGLLVIGFSFISTLAPPVYCILSSGLAAGIFLLYLGLQLSDRDKSSSYWGLAFALGTLFSVAFRALGSTLDITITGNTKYIGWLLMALTIRLLIKAYSLSDKKTDNEKPFVSPVSDSPWLNCIGLAGAILLIYFAFSSPGVITRWTGANYVTVNIIFTGALFAWVLITQFVKLDWVKNRNLLLIWNGIFVLALVFSIVSQIIRFPAAPGADPVVVNESSYIGHVLTYLTVLLAPVIFANVTVFSNKLKSDTPSKIAAPFSFAALLIILCSFMLIFTNVWGYVGDVSRMFRNKFYLPFAIAGVFMMIPYLFRTSEDLVTRTRPIPEVPNRKIIGLAVSLFVACLIGLYLCRPVPGVMRNEPYKLTLMTYNIQQGVDLFGNKNLSGQLGLIKTIDPDIICLQESDAARISGGNSDAVQYFTNHLNYHTYYGPKTVTGTFGTAIISRFPLESCKTIFTYSNKDEIGTAISRISLGNRLITIVNSHPAGGKEARQAHIDMLTKVALENENVIAMGDYNFTQRTPYYQQITRVLQDAWLTLYPSGVGPVFETPLDKEFTGRKKSGGELLGNNLQDMSAGIDHIFISKDFEILEAHYLPAPESQTDHPAHWAVVQWQN